jgi:GTP cyclohydrolase I
MNQDEKNQVIDKAEEAYGKFMDAILPNWREDPNSKETPKRVAKMFVNELWAGLFGELPKITVFENTETYDGMVFQGNIEVKSQCSHHHMPFFGVAHVAYIPGPSNKIIGLSKLNRVVEYYSRRPQVQENLTMQIHDFLSEIFGDALGIAVVIEAQHTCVSHRGIRQTSIMKTSKLSGMFFENNVGTREEFYNFINQLKK